MSTINTLTGITYQTSSCYHFNFWKKIGIVLGTGLDSALVKDLENSKTISFGKIPHFVQTTFHKGILILGNPFHENFTEGNCIDE